MELILVIGGAIELTPRGIVRSLRERAWGLRNERLLKSDLAKLVCEPEYQPLFEARSRALLFVQLGDEDRVEEPAQFPADGEWCQICALQFEMKAFLALDASAQRQQIVASARTALRKFLRSNAPGSRLFPKRSHARSRKSTDWVMSLPLTDSRDVDELEHRHTIECGLDSHLGGQQAGSVSGGQSGAGSMEIFIELTFPRSEPWLRQFILRALLQAGIDPPEQFGLQPEDDWLTQPR